VAVIRPARAGDLVRLRAVERAAGGVFRDIGMGPVTDDEPLTVSDLAGYQQDGRAWVAVDEQDRPVAYLLIDRVDNGAHVEQVSVHPDHARQGVGLALIDTAVIWAARHNLAALTLTTFREVPWNAPYYTRVGFRVMTEDQMTSSLCRIREHEAARGLARWPRVTMRRPITRPVPPSG